MVVKHYSAQTRTCGHRANGWGSVTPNDEDIHGLFTAKYLKLYGPRLHLHLHGRQRVRFTDLELVLGKQWSPPQQVPLGWGVLSVNKRF
ncbi:hypothetical protein RRG08_039926 [Elysia crispata]|uniref:Uncharacterized protein n=1 Tax=Elysia crispata TaxID=231223 RepID=A0AAE1EEC8_9GAST|nr:hypothetical protein RRG08_039926 [Elysia crispata]